MMKVNRETGEILSASVRPHLRALYDDHMPMSDATGLKCEDESLASQSEAEECDINTLAKRFGLTGQLPQNVRAPMYGDFTEAKDYQQSLNALVQAQNSFMAMPADIRSRFDNNPHLFVEFCQKDENYDQMCDWGLLAPDAMTKRVEARRAKEQAELEGKVQAEIAKREKASKEAGHS